MENRGGSAGVGFWGFGSHARNHNFLERQTFHSLDDSPRHPQLAVRHLLRGQAVEQGSVTAAQQQNFRSPPTIEDWCELSVETTCTVRSRPCLCDAGRHRKSQGGVSGFSHSLGKMPWPDPDIPILIGAKAKYEKLQWPLEFGRRVRFGRFYANIKACRGGANIATIFRSRHHRDAQQT